LTLSIATRRDASSISSDTPRLYVAGAVQTLAVRITGSDPVLAVHDLDRSADWLVRVLGCERADPDPGNWVFSAAGDVTFMLGRCPDVAPASSIGDHTTLRI
jgi:hypothetical protein